MHDIVDVNLKDFAAQLRQAADDLERGDIVAVAVISCDGEGSAMNCCMVDQNRATHELLDEMVYAAKQMLFQSFEDGK